MITSVYYRPHIWSATYNPIVWSVQSDKYTEVDFSYVFDVYINGATSDPYRIKQKANPAGAGMIDVAPIVKSHIDLNSTFEGKKNSNTQYFSTSIDSVASVYLKVGEEYTPAGGELTIFNGYGSTGDPSFPLYSIEGNSIGVGPRCLPASLEYRDNLEIMGLTSANPFWDSYIMDGDGKFLSNDPGRREVRWSDHNLLTFLNRWDSGDPVSRNVFSVEGVYYGATGELARYKITNLTGYGGGPQINLYDSSTTETYDTDMISFDAGPNSGWANGVIPSNTTYYSMTAYYRGSTGDINPGTQASETVWFDIMEEPCSSLYPVIRLSWLNSLGGRDYYNFSMFYEKTTSSDFDTYYQTPLNWGSTTPVAMRSTSISDPLQSDNWIRGGAKQINKKTQTRFSIQSDWLTQEYVDFLGEIPESPQVWAYLDGSYSHDSDYVNGNLNFIPVTINVLNTEYSYKNVLQQKLVQVSFDCEILQPKIKQNI